jgi:hypothetical protein
MLWLLLLAAAAAVVAATPPTPPLTTGLATLSFFVLPPQGETFTEIVFRLLDLDCRAAFAAFAAAAAAAAAAAGPAAGPATTTDRHDPSA